MHLQTLLENVGLEVVTAPNGERGLQAARDLLPDVIVLDVEMPGMNGFEVYQHLKAEPDTAPIPVILLTCHDDQETVIEGLELGVIEYIPKDTFADVVLVETLRQMGIVK
jgi:CheY-like chemotaxis protein